MLGGMNTRERLVDATQELLWEQGYAATSPKDILHRAGAGQGSMYHHFAGNRNCQLLPFTLVQQRFVPMWKLCWM